MITLTIILLAAAQLQRAAERIDQRIRQAQYVEAVEARERYRQDVLTQRIPRPASHLSLAEEAANRKAEIDRWLITPEALRATIEGLKLALYRDANSSINGLLIEARAVCS